MTLDWSAVYRGRCVVCGGPIIGPGAPVCRVCGLPTTVTLRPVSPTIKGGDLTLQDAKSDCHNADVDLAGTRITCSEACHETFVGEIERKFGREKVVVDTVTGRRHLVPTRRIIECGIRQEELGSFPEAPP